MILLIIFLTLLAFIILLTLIPVVLKIDSNHGIYQLEWKGVTSARLMFVGEEPVARLKIFFWKKDFNLLEMGRKKSKKPKKAKPKRKKKSNSFSLKKVKSILKTFRVKQFFLNLDTGNYIWNAYLFPIFYFLKNENRNVQINFDGDVELVLEIDNRPIKIIYAFIFK